MSERPVQSDVDEAPAPIDDHKHEAPEGREWDRCIHCGLTAAAHTESVTPYRPPAA